MKRLCLLIAVALFAPLAHATTYQWTNTLGGDWFTLANWSPNGTPGTFDTANITSAGTYTVTISSGVPAVANLNLGGSSGTQTLIENSASVLDITNAGTVGPNGVLTVNSGGLKGILTVNSGGQLILATATVKVLASFTLFNQGTVAWSGGQLQGGGTPSTIISNGGSWQMTGDNIFNLAFGGQPLVWNNSGTLTKTAGTGASQILNFNFINQPGGVINASSGTLQLGSDTNSMLGGSLTATTPGAINISGGTWTDAGGAASGSGLSQFSAGTLNLRTNIISGLKLTGGDVFITGTSTFQQAGAITSLTLDGAFLRGTNQVGSGTLTVNSGGLSGQLTVNSGGQLILATAAVKVVSSFTLFNQGTVAWSGGQLQGGGTPSTIINNNGLWQMTGDNIFNLAFGGQSLVWNNSGTLTKTAGTGASQLFNFNFINLSTGVINASSGTLQLSSDTNSILGGSLTASSPGTVSLVGGTWTDAGGTASGSGLNQFSGGTLNLRTNIISGLKLTGGDVFVTGTITFQQAGAITNLSLDGAFLRGTSQVGNGTLTVNSGGLSGQLTINAGGQLVLATTTVKNLSTFTLFNQGTVAWSGGQLQGGGTPSTIISNGGSWQITGDNVFNLAFGGQPLVWTNSGTLTKTAGTGASQILNFNFLNQSAGVINASSGTLQLGSDTNSMLGGSLTATAPGGINISGGTWADAGGTASGSGINQFSGGTLNLRTNIIPGLKLTGGDVFITGTSTFQQVGAITNLTLDGAFLRGTNQVGSGTLTANSGGLSGQLTVSSVGQLVLATTTVKNLANFTLFNQGTVSWSGGQLQGGGTPSTIISNGGSWQITGDNVFNLAFGGQPPVWTNSGTLAKTGGTGISTIDNFTFTNLAAGLIRADTGTLQLPSGTTNSAGTLRLNGGTLQASGTLAMNGGTLDGAGSFGLNSFSGGIISPGQGGAGLMTFPSGLNLSSGATLAIDGTGTTPGSQYDQLSVIGSVVLGNSTLQVNSLPSVPPGTTFIIIANDAADAVSGTFNGLPENSPVNVSGQPFRIHYAGGTGNDVTLVRDGAVPGPQLSGAAYTNGKFSLSGAGGSSVIYTIRATTNFTAWTNIGSVTSTVSGNFNFTDTNAFQFPYRFYQTTN